MRSVLSTAPDPARPEPRRLHVLVLTDRDWTHPQGGGTGTNLYGQIQHWLLWGHRVTVVAANCPGGRAVEHHGALTLHRVGGRSTVFPHAIVRQLRGLVPDADVVLEVINGIAFMTPLWLRTPRVALVHHIHRRHYAVEMGTRGRIACVVLETAPLRTIYRGAPFLTVSESAAADIAAHGIARGQIEVNYNGVDSRHYRPGAKAIRPTILVLGRLKRYKNIEWVLDAAAGIPAAHVHIVGEGDWRGQLEARVGELGMAGRVTLHGHVSEAEKVRLLQESWVHVIASVAEGWSLAVMEAAACHTPSVALAQGGLTESVQHDRTGLLAADQTELTVQTARVLADGPLRERLGAAAYERSLTFGWDRTARRTMAALGRALGKGEVSLEPVEAPVPGADPRLAQLADAL